MREALQLFWTVADGYAKRRLLLALALVAAGALLAALTPIALKLVVGKGSRSDFPRKPGSGAGAATARFVLAAGTRANSQRRVGGAAGIRVQLLPLRLGHLQLDLCERHDVVQRRQLEQLRSAQPIAAHRDR